MDGSPRGRKRSYSALIEQTPPPEQPWAPETKSSPLPQNYESPSNMKMPMPLHHPKAGLLRTRSPLVGQNLLSFPNIHFPRASTPLARTRTLGAPLPYSYGSLVTLDPASLSPTPDPVAVAEIKRLIPQSLQWNGHRDVSEMVDALTADSSSTDPSPDQVEKPATVSNQIIDGLFEDYTAEMAGAEFDVFLSQMAVQDLTDCPVTKEHVDPDSH
ncbi:uncharacterized protein Z520_07398 [Fonsecaea multimorphosa CBS 102226]|uniref:Uncharacterized protein n=1 Tax=Fonsecaea multimorphosa CBS 102226 TaxID=1442371 RepID=A0A0D2K0Z8_9EURO|nr:uncharacterized protein Z520_07398 [Fonsecaea multimorphosa CBS 102226]KIX96679.1 hypothetical protein Z520_07398 [Fonsecaea multimorphosa CBS 102226]OAL20760.1 hypothetical protein AYO22_08769 [Fonsecaea multimorphosa]